MKQLKRYIALALTLVLLLGVLPAHAFADEEAAACTECGQTDGHGEGCTLAPSEQPSEEPPAECPGCGETENHKEDCPHNVALTSEEPEPQPRSTATITPAYNVNFTDYGPGADNDTTPDAIAKDDKFQLTLTLTGANVSNQSYTYTTLAGYVLKTSDYSSESYDNVTVEGADGATVSFKRDGDHSVVTFTFPEGYTDTANATVTLYGIFEDPEKADSADGTDDGTVNFPGGGSLPIYTPPTTGQTHSVNVYKDGERKENANGDIIFHYVIQVQAPDGDLTNITVVDKPEAGMEILTDTVILSDYSSNYYSGDQLQTTVEEDSWNNTKTYKWNISSIPDNSIKYIHYDAKVIDTNKTSFSNEVTATAGDKSASSYETVYLNTPVINKTGSKNGDTITWTIRVTFNDFGTIKLNESASGDMKNIMADSVNANAQYTVTYQPSNRQATGSVAQWLSSQELLLTKEENETSATVTFNTVIPSTWGDTHTTVDNTVNYQYGDTSGNTSASVPVEANPRILSKEGKDQASDHSANHYYGGKPIIDWTIELSFADKPDTLYKGNAKFADILLDTHSDYEEAGKLDHRYIENSFKLYLNGEEVTLSDYITGPTFIETQEDPQANTMEDWIHDAFWHTSNAFTSQWEGQKAFYFTFNESAPAGNYKLTYQTEYTPGNAESGAYARMENAFFGGDNYEYKKTDVEVPINYITKTAGRSNNYNNTYNATEGTVKWYVQLVDPYINEFTNILYFFQDPNVQIVDTLPQGFELKSIKWVDNYYQTPVNVVEYDPDSYYGSGTIPAIYYTEGENNQFTVTITNQKLNNNYGMLNFGSYLEIETEYKGFDDLTPGKTSSAFTNEAYIIVNDTPYPKVEASVTFTPPPLISKSIRYIRENAPRPEFTVEVNPNGQDLMKNSDTITVRDVIEDTNQTFLPDTLEVYEGVGNEKSSAPVDKSIYQVTATGKEFTITGLKDAQAYTITYRTRVNVAYDSSETFELKNKVYLDGVCRDMDGNGTVGADEFVYAEAKYNGKVVLPSAMGVVNVNKATVFVNKKDELGNPLAGAVFTIYSDEDCTTVVGTITSGVEGISDGCTLNSTNATYYMKETKAPEGYKLSDEVYKFGRYTSVTCPNDVDNINGNTLMKIYEVVNELDGPSTTSLTIKKSGGATDETFIMNVSGDGKTFQVAVPANGEVTIDGLTVDEKYTVTEDMNWAWRYSANSGEVTLDADAEKNIVTITNTKNKNQWLSGDSYCENRWGADGNVTRK